jgi:hypothetical protein
MFASADDTIDSKLMTLWKLYADNQQVATTLRDVEGLRASSQNIGLAVSIAAFGLNEVARLTLRSRKQFTMRPFPSIFSYSYVFGV